MIRLNQRLGSSDKRAYLKNLRRYLKPQGRVAIVDFSDRWPWFHGKMKYWLAELDAWMKAAGIAQVEKHDFVKDNFFVIYRPVAEP